MSNSASYIQRIEDGLQAAGKALGDLASNDLAPVDQFHVGGMDATLRLIQGAGIGSEDHVIDIGAGTGGPARQLAELTGCTVTGADLNEVSVSAGIVMTNWVGLSEQVTLVQANATDLPFSGNTFDHALSIHVGMFIADKKKLYGEAYRVLKPGGRLLIFDPCETGVGSHPYPVPWAKEPDENHIMTIEGQETELSHVGFKNIETIDRTQEIKAWFAARPATAGDGAGPPALGLHLMVGPEFPVMAANASYGVKNGAISFIEFHASKPR